MKVSKKKRREKRKRNRQRELAAPFLSVTQTVWNWRWHLPAKRQRNVFDNWAWEAHLHIYSGCGGNSVAALTRKSWKGVLNLSEIPDVCVSTKLTRRRRLEKFPAGDCKPPFGNGCREWPVLALLQRGQVQGTFVWNISNHFERVMRISLLPSFLTLSLPFSFPLPAMCAPNATSIWTGSSVENIY